MRSHFWLLAYIVYFPLQSVTPKATREMLEAVAGEIAWRLERGEFAATVGAEALRRLPSRKGMFVSVFDRRTRALRGCMGALTPQKQNLYDEVAHWTTMAMMHDQRGASNQKKKPREYALILSFIEGVEPVTDPWEIDSVTHGILAKFGGREELVLPGEAFTTAYALKIIARKFGINALPANAEFFRIHAERFGKGKALFKKIDKGYGG